jgi:hypothetical protein
MTPQQRQQLEEARSEVAFVYRELPFPSSLAEKLLRVIESMDKFLGSDSPPAPKPCWRCEGSGVRSFQETMGSPDHPCPACQVPTPSSSRPARRI